MIIVSAISAQTILMVIKMAWMMDGTTPREHLVITIEKEKETIQETK